MEQILKFLISYKKQFIYIFIASLGFIIGILIHPTCDRDNICQEDIFTKNAAITRLNKREEEYTQELRNKEDSLKESCNISIAKALKNNNINSSELDCLICGGILKQCIEQ